MGEDNKTEKISGYLEKKGKLRLMSSWKKYWFVLEGRLLLYYRSKDEYDAISPCKGSINLGPLCCIKPCSSVQFAFQIETRNNTITLRTESRADQNRWMQAMMTALNQNANAARLSHFRYSLDNLATTKEKTKSVKPKNLLERQNTMPERLTLKNPKRKSQIIRRLQKIGAQSYGGSFETIQKLSKQNQDITRDEILNLVKIGKFIDESKNKSIETRNEEGKSTSRLNNPEKETEHEETIQGNNQEKNDDSLPNLENGVMEKQFDSKNDLKKLKSRNSSKSSQDEQPEDFLINNVHYSVITSNINDSEIPQETQTVICDKNKNDNSDDNEKAGIEFMVENDNYSLVNKLTRSNSFDVGEDRSCSNILIENVEYIGDSSSQRNSNSSGIYEEPKMEGIDQNKNNIITDNPQYVSIDEDIYPEYEQTETPERMENQYECVEDFQDKKEESCNGSSENRCKRKNKSKLMIFNNKNSKDPKEKKESVKLKKSASFMKRLWIRKRSKSKDEDEIYEEIDNGGKPETIIKTNEIESAVQMLYELQNILENKKAKIEEKLSKDVEPASPTCLIDTPILNQTQPSLEKIDCCESAEKPQESQELLTENIAGEVCPLIPKKLGKGASPYHDFPRNNFPVIPPRSSPKKPKEQQSIDEILRDLEREDTIRRSMKNKVKQLIEQFDEAEKDGVILRKFKDLDIQEIYRNSDDLDVLLNELTKVTTAPVLPSGATRSLVNPTLSNEEWLKLVPIRKRRSSDPDYDIPRSHKSLQNLKSKENQENILTGTRFFGPVLGDNENEEDSSDSDCSMTPDSLEPPDGNRNKQNHKLATSISFEETQSYTSHTYHQNISKSIENVLNVSTKPELKCSTYNYRKQMHNNRKNARSVRPKESLPKERYVEVKPCKFSNKKKEQFVEDSIKDDEVFIDSLEPCA